MDGKHKVRLTVSLERNLDAIEQFLDEAGATEAFDALLTDLTDTVIPNLERFPGMGRSFLERPVRSIEAGNGVDRLRSRLSAIDQDGELREYVLSNHLILYARIGSTIYLLSIRHHRQLSFDFESLWPEN